MNPHKCFQIIINQIQSTTFAPAFKAEVLSCLSYFQTQSLLDLDRRDSPSIIRGRWRELEARTRSLGIFDEIKKRDDVWRVVRCFVYDAEPSSLLVPVVERAYVKPTSRFHSSTPEDFFELLSKEAERAPLLSPDESLALVHGLLFLKASAALPKPKRNTQKIRKVWTSMHPILKKLGMTDEFSRDEGMKNRLRLFIENTL